MIFGSLGLLIVAGSLLAAGIAKGSTGFLVVSLVCTVAAGALLLLAYSSARAAASGDALATGAVPAPGGWPTATPGNGAPALVYVPVSQVPGALAGALPGHNGGNGGGHPGGVLAGEAPILGYEEMTAEQIGKLISSGALNSDQLLAVRSYEQAHDSRKTVLDRIDRALQHATR